MKPSPNQDVHAIILAGGSGTRFWPLSRETCPKQMLQIVGEDTLLRQTIKRINGFIPPENTWIVTTEEMAQDLRFHVEALGSFTKRIQFIQEPFGRNTAPAIGLAAIYLNHLSSESVMIVMPSDHAIPDTEIFLNDLRLAIQGTKGNNLVTFGIKPSRPETGYGYIKVDQSVKRTLEAFLRLKVSLKNLILRLRKDIYPMVTTSGIQVSSSGKPQRFFQKLKNISLLFIKP